MTHPVWTILAAAAVLALVACAAPPVPAETDEPAQPGQTGLLQSQQERIQQPPAPVQDVAGLVAGNTDFAFDLYQQLAGQDGNLFYSPYSISLALAMTRAGAGGETLAEMDRTLHFSLPAERLHPAFNALDQQLAAKAADKPEYVNGEPFQLDLANSLWGQSGYDFYPTFLDLLAENYGAGMHLVDFKTGAESARQTINAWVSEHTGQKIQDLLAPGTVDPTTRLVLANAIYFKAGWVFPFEEDQTHAAPFHLLDGGTVDVSMMSQSQDFDYAQGDGWQAVELPYVSQDFSMLLLVPDEGTLAAFEAGLDAGQLADILGRMSSVPVDLQMPRFQFESGFSLQDTLKALGMRQAFDLGQADFSAMAPGNELYIGDVVHKAYVDVNEKGTEAAAATAVVMLAGAMPQVPEPVVLTIDRPFLFLIRSHSSGTILFVGRVVQP
jgi:serpin B